MDSVPANDRTLLNRILDKLDDHQKQMSTMQTSVAILVDGSSRAGKEREEIAKRLNTVERSMETNTMMTANVQQDVAEMKNEQANVKVALEDYQRSKLIALEAISEVAALKKFKDDFALKEQRALGWWDVVYRIGWVGWTIICAVGAAAIGLLFYWLQKFV